MWYFLIFPVIFVLWRAYRFGGVWQIISSLAYIAVSGGISIGIFKTMMKQNLLKKKKKLIAYVVFAVLADQLIKVIICQYQPDINLIGKALRIQMVLNREQSVLYSFFNIHMQTAVIIIQKILIFGAVTVVYIKWKQKNQYYAYAYIMFLTAMTASVIDSALWGFTVDYLNFYQLFCHDLKDLYVDTAVGFLLLGMREDRKCEYAGTTLMIIISSILIEIKSYNTVFIRIKIAIILLTFILIGISSYIKLKSYKS